MNIKFQLLLPFHFYELTYEYFCSKSDFILLEICQT